MRYHSLLLFIYIGLSFSEECRKDNRTDFYRSKSGECLSCLSYCNQQTSVCLHVNQLKHLCSTIYFARNLRECEEKLTPSVVHTYLLWNQTNFDNSDQYGEPVCLFCGNFTRGLRCESCRPRPNGKQLSYLIELKTPISTCYDCSCSGQTYDCQTNVSDGCSCLTHLLDSNLVDLNLYQCLSNRTFSVEQEQNQCRSKIHQQCGACKRGYNGVASERGHRCYKILTTDTTQCFEYSNSLRTCINSNEIVRSEDNRTISFEVTPSYRNLNIRVLIGIETGFVDVICSIRNSNFIVLNDYRIFYEHQSLIDEQPNIRDFDLTYEDFNFGILYSDPSEIIILRNISSKHRLTILISPTNIDFTQDNLRCLIINDGRKDPYEQDLIDSTFQSGKFSLSDYRAIYLTTSSSALLTKSFGYIKIYQSRMNIDLFVFFSVFFSSFFLFLSVGICFWKVKFAYEIHRRRRTIKHEYHKRMARPFAKIQLLIKPSIILSNQDDQSEQLNSPIPSSSSIDIPLLLPSSRTDIDYSSHVVAVEPLRDERTSYTTLLFHLPGDLSTQYRLCAGTTLTHLSNDYLNALTNAKTEHELLKKTQQRRKYNKHNRHRMKMIRKKPNINQQQQQQQQQQQHRKTTQPIPAQTTFEQ